MDQYITHRDVFEARAILLGERFDLRALENNDVLDIAPLTIKLRGGGLAVLSRFGALVLFDVTSVDEAALFDYLIPLVSNPYDTPERERIEIRIDAQTREGMRGNILFLQNTELEKLQIIADILCKSVVLNLYEARLKQEFDRTEPLALQLGKTGRVMGNAKELIKHIGALLISEHRMVGRAEVTDKPELLWEHPQLNGLFGRMEDEFEIRERHAAIERKLNLLSHTTNTLLELLHNRHSMRVEWYIVILILFELLLSVFSILH